MDFPPPEPFQSAPGWCRGSVVGPGLPGHVAVSTRSPSSGGFLPTFQSTLILDRRRVLTFLIFKGQMSSRFA
jgi:hypothetical protein